MKSKLVIQMLQELDPTGECEVCVGNIDIFDIVIEPAYWDGCYQRLVRDETKECYNIIGGEYISEGNKICIDGMSIKSALWNDPELPVKFLDDEMNMDDYKQSVEEERKEAREWADGREERKASLTKIREKQNEKD